METQTPPDGGTECKIFYVWCRTGCPCCDYLDHLRGPYSTREQAERRIGHFLGTGRFIPVQSRSAKRGEYEVVVHDGIRYSGGTDLGDGYPFFFWDNVMNRQVRPDFIRVDSSGSIGANTLYEVVSAWSRPQLEALANIQQGETDHEEQQ